MRVLTGLLAFFLIIAVPLVTVWLSQMTEADKEKFSTPRWKAVKITGGVILAAVATALVWSLSVNIWQLI